MYIIAIVLGLILLVVAYFLIGILLQFLWGWFPLITSVLIGIISIVLGGWILAGLAIIIFLIALNFNNKWHDKDIYLKVENHIGNIFYFKD